MPTPYLVSTISTEIYEDEFDSDSSIISLTSISGWLDSNVGLLNTALYTCFSGSGSAGDVVIQPSGTFGFEEADIYKKMYLKNYYTKRSRTILNSANGSTDFITLVEGDTRVTKTSKTDLARIFKGLAQDASKELTDLIGRYNIYKASPRQVAGVDGDYNLSGYNYPYTSRYHR